ncbi:hypothetical protein FSOLCH5_003174 [Fusarium solani]|uniref:Concanavalin A-like lectin/glucanase domain-containing protein n=1 Tax=Fusarium solani TaxID=169388 RepID=A0A9P9L2R8_FUSSL|nr:concanavalin A-like lectin/glucanase domain-containing protein [Fusarium solani]KAH7272884.1 concanavalin A-like lectin/glucanase domain-containing protein [Fusarium solani]KAJ4229823.1 hypothetical protein NW759_003191 [Fusarium solani]
MLSIRSLYLQLAVLSTVVHGTSTGDDECDCYLTNGTNSAYYSQHKFFDFRDLGKYAGVPDVIKNASETGDITSDYFESDDWNDSWGIQDWSNRKSGGVSLSGDASVLMVNSPNNIYIEKNEDDDAASDTFLTMRTVRLKDFQTAAEFESVSTYHYLSLRMLARVTGSAGACMAMFTYLEGDELADVQEADIEILTHDPKNRIQYTNQPSFTDDGDEVPKATRNGTLPKGLGWDDWVVHRLDWTPARSVWYVAGQEVASIEFQTPKDPAQVLFNAWSDGGSWSGNMSLNGAAYMQIQWIEMVYNGTDSEGSDKRSLDGHSETGHVERRGMLAPREDDENGCKAVCSIDDVDEAGKTKVLWKSAASCVTAPIPRGWTTGLVVMGIMTMTWFV